MRENRVVINYDGSGEYEPSDEELSEWAKELLNGIVGWREENTDGKWLKESKREFNKHAAIIIDKLMTKFDDDCAFAEFLAEKFPDDLRDYFREAYEREAAENDEPTLKELEDEEYNAVVAAGLRR